MTRKFTKEEIARGYADYYLRQQQYSGCGGPVLMACVVLAIIILISI